MLYAAIPPHIRIHQANTYVFDFATCLPACLFTCLPACLLLGYPTMAVTACFASPLFVLLAGEGGKGRGGGRGGKRGGSEILGVKGSGGVRGRGEGK